MNQDREIITVLNQDEVLHAELSVWNLDPIFLLPLEPGQLPDEMPIEHGDILVRKSASGRPDRRPILGLTYEGSIGGACLRLIAPRQITMPDPNRKYVNMDNICLRPGTVIVGGRESGFYDAFGIIIEGHHVGGDPAKFEDWIYYVIGPSDFEEYAPQWLLLRDIGFPTADPTTVISFPFEPNNPVDNLLLTGEHELLDYFTAHPSKLDQLSPQRFEELMVAIYRNLGFRTEPVGAWNQADGGVDIIAVSKTEANTEYRIAVQCKASKNRITARPIRELAGVLDVFRAHQGVVATTSTFTRAARREAKGHLWRVSLQDRNDIFRKLMSLVRPEFKGFIDLLGD